MKFGSIRITGPSPLDALSWRQLATGIYLGAFCTPILWSTGFFFVALLRTGEARLFRHYLRGMALQLLAAAGLVLVQVLAVAVLLRPWLDQPWQRWAVVVLDLQASAGIWYGMAVAGVAIYAGEALSPARAAREGRTPSGGRGPKTPSGGRRVVLG